MKKTVFFKISAGYLTIIFLLSASLSLFSFQTFKTYYKDMLVDALRKEADLLMLTVGPLYARNKNNETDALFKKIAPSITTRITLINRDGTVVADSEKDPAIMENHKTRPEVIQAIYGQTGSSLRHSSTVAEDMLYVAVPIVREGNVTGVLRLSLFMHDISRMIDGFQKGILYIGLLITFLALAISFIVARKFTRPIRTLGAAARNVAEGNFDTRVFLQNTDELREFGDSFNYMTEKIRDLFNEISLQREELKNIITSMHEYLLVLDAEGRIVLCNESFKKFIANDTPEKKYYWEVIREAEFAELIRTVRQKKNDYINEISIDGRVLLCSMSWIAQQEEIVAVCLDMTEIRNVERMKKDFVVNVSHELRTPLTAIKGFIDTMVDDVSDQTHRRYLDIIKRHTDRLINIVQDLLSLAKLEEEQRLVMEEINLFTLIEQVRKIYEQKLLEKKLFLQISVDSNVLPITADPFKLEQVFINLIDNAIKYTEQGGITIEVCREDSFTRICIKDTGIGIKDKHLSRIFERFYVVDKARSRQAGGTGLGLSIVKHIILLHKGTIDVQSMVGKGTTFILKLPNDSSAVETHAI